MAVQSPSLTARLALMRKLTQAVEKLHAVNWLHKGLCSENVVFFPGHDVGDVLTEPYLSGFDYSRPGLEASMSSNPVTTAAEDLYRHPAVQGGPQEGSSRSLGYRKRHDLYSLGVVLVEIARWNTIAAVLGIENEQNAKVRDALGARSKLLSAEQSGHLRGTVGDAVSDAIRACLVGLTAFDLADMDREEEGQTAAKLQMMFYNVVVKPLFGSEHLIN